MLVLFGCNRTKISDNDLFLLGVNTKDIEKIEMINGNIIFYPDKKQNDNLTVIEDLNRAFINAGDRMEILDEKLGITLADAEGYSQNDSENYFVYITFSKPQTLRLVNKNNEEIPNCDGILFDINNLKLYWSEEGNFKGVMGFSDDGTSAESDFSTFIKNIESIFVDLRS
jgi:hypothetical protein